MTQAASRSMDPWEGVRSILKSLWCTEGRKLDHIVQEMRTKYNFHRVASQYKAQFKKWGWSKNVRKNDITIAVKHYKGRAAVGKPCTRVFINGKQVESQKVRRAMKDQMREATRLISLNRNEIATVDGRVLSFTDSFFLKWNLPYAAMRRLYVRPFDHSSPFDQTTPCSVIEVTTPPPTASPDDAPSPTTQIAKDFLMVDRACMFAQGHHEKLLNLLDGEERMTLSDWLHQYWFFCFKTAKHWGKGPRMWTAELLNFDQYLSTDPSSVLSTPQDISYHSTPHTINEPTMPSDLCRWYIHTRSQSYEGIEEDEFEPSDFDQPDLDQPDLDQPDPDQFDFDDDATWPSWSLDEQQTSLHAHLRNALEHNEFSTTPTTDLPVAIPELAKAADEERSNELLLESLGFSIISRNLVQINRILRQLFQNEIDTSPLHPFHLAVSFLDGSESCCDVVYALADWITGAQVFNTYVNEHGHTILDNLMISIIKSHTSAKPVVVDDNFKDVARFFGEEVDICGRWDADSPCIRQLYAHGHISIPSSWKHKFCNTSIQAWIVYSTMLRFRLWKKLQLSPLHSLVMTAYHLATQGRDDEDLFGILACAVCLIFHGFDPSVRADISVAALLSLDSFVECDHVELTAAELAEEIMAMPAFGLWDIKIKTGWVVLTGILHRCEAAHVKRLGKRVYLSESSCDSDPVPFAEPDEDTRFMGYTKPDMYLTVRHKHIQSRSHCFIEQKDLGALWSSVQAEFLSYRRLNDGLGWTSQYFSMETLREQLNGGKDLAVGYTEHNLLKAHCSCHSFGRYAPTMLSDAVDPGLANLNGLQGRASYGGEPELQ
ncbi:unnamed protein product [Alternaria alternata]